MANIFAMCLQMSVQGFVSEFDGKWIFISAKGFLETCEAACTQSSA